MFELPVKDKIKYAVYYNINNKIIRIHKIPSPHKLQIRGGNHEYRQGGWGFFVYRGEANKFAKGISRMIKNFNDDNLTYCKKCYK